MKNRLQRFFFIFCVVTMLFGEVPMAAIAEGIENQMSQTKAAQGLADSGSLPGIQPEAEPEGKREETREQPAPASQQETQPETKPEEKTEEPQKEEPEEKKESQPSIHISASISVNGTRNVEVATQPAITFVRVVVEKAGTLHLIVSGLDVGAYLVREGRFLPKIR